MKVGQDKAELDTPVLWVDLDVLERNILHMASAFQAAGVYWRPHVKGIKVPAIAHQMLAAGALGVTCAKVSEADVMAAAGIGDILIANQIVAPGKIARLVNLRRRADVKVAVDDANNVAQLGQAAQEKGVELGVVVEVDTGMGRAGVAPGEPALHLSRTVHGTPGLRYLGLMGWEGHARAIDGLEARRPVIEGAVRRLTDTARLCREAGLPAHIVSAGGTGTYYVTAYEPGITEIQAGGGVFGDVASQRWEVPTEPALFVRTTVTSRPAADRIIVDAGFKALPGWHSIPQPLGLAGFATFETSAEHGKVRLEVPDSTVRVGDALDFVVGYSDETVCLYDELVGIRNGIVEVIWPIQGRGKIQ
jgi:D-serine deaminase-like pyridoxal phosphate-dependent protein